MCSKSEYGYQNGWEGAAVSGPEDSIQIDSKEILETGENYHACRREYCGRGVRADRSTTRSQGSCIIAISLRDIVQRHSCTAELNPEAWHLPKNRTNKSLSCASIQAPSTYSPCCAAPTGARARGQAAPRRWALRAMRSHELASRSLMSPFPRIEPLPRTESYPAGGDSPGLTPGISHRLGEILRMLRKRQ